MTTLAYDMDEEIRRQKPFSDAFISWAGQRINVIGIELADKDEVARALYKEVGGDFSYYSFYFTLTNMKKLGFNGLPYIDCKTYKGWMKAGFQVKKGEKSKIYGITWLKTDTEDDDDKFIFPKVYRLFHKSQVKERE